MILSCQGARYLGCTVYWGHLCDVSFVEKACFDIIIAGCGNGTTLLIVGV